MSFLQRSRCDVTYHALIIHYILRIPGFVQSADNIELISVLQFKNKVRKKKSVQFIFF